MKKIRLAHIAGGLTTGGVEAVIYNYFSHIDRADYDLVYISYDTPLASEQKKFEELGFTVYSVTKKKENFIKSCKEVLEIYKKHKINVIHSHMTLMSFVTSFLGLCCGVKVRIAHSHLAQKPTGLKKYIYGIFKVLSKITSNVWFACGKEAAIYLYGEKNLVKGKVKIINNAVDYKKYEPNERIRKRIREQYQIDQKTLCFGHVGRYTEQKNHQFLIEIFAQINKEQPNSVLLLVGNGPLMDDVMVQIERLGLKNAVIMAGACDNVNELYQAMDVFLFPSLYEGLAVVLVETQAAGLTIFTSDTVTKEIAITKNIRYLSLRKSAKEWAVEVLKETKIGPKKPSLQTISSHGYDILKEAVKLNEFYQEKIL